MCEVVDDFALKESLDIVDHDLFACIDDFDKAEFEIRDCLVEWYVVFYPALKVLDGICAIPAHILFTVKMWF